MLKSPLLLSILLVLIPLSSSDPNPPTLAHAELTNYGFPIGLLPVSVQSYTLNQTSGEFFIHLGGACRLTLPPDNYLATYSNKIRGKIEQGRIAELDGIRVRAFFKWWAITGIRSSGDNLVFEIGMVTAKYPSKNFDESPECDGHKSAAWCRFGFLKFNFLKIINCCYIDQF